jgi:hypothetical protein
MDNKKLDNMYVINSVYKWEKLRILYNIVMLIVGIPIAVLIYRTLQGLPPTFHDSLKIVFDVGGIIKASIIFSLFANLFYCLGPLVDIYYYVFIKKQMSRLFRYGLFIAGLLLSLAVQFNILIFFIMLKGEP